LGVPIKWAIAVDSLTRNLSLIFAVIFLGPITKQPVDLSLMIEFINLLSLLLVKSSKLFAIVNRVKGFNSNAVKSNLLKGNISLSIISFSRSILIILFELLCSEIVKPEILSIISARSIMPS